MEVVVRCTGFEDVVVGIDADTTLDDLRDGAVAELGIKPSVVQLNLRIGVHGTNLVCDSDVHRLSDGDVVDAVAVRVPQVNPHAAEARSTTLHNRIRRNATKEVFTYLSGIVGPVPDVNLPSGEPLQETPLQLAVLEYNPKVCRALIAAGADVDAVARDSSTALHLAARQDAVECAMVLLEHEADIHGVDQKGFTPIHVAAAFGAFRVASELLEKGADVQALTTGGMTPLHLCPASRVAVARALIQRGADQEAEDASGKTPVRFPMIRAPGI